MLKNLTWSWLVLVKTPQNNKNINITINNEELEQNDYAKYLGIYIDKKLSRRKQTENILQT